LRAGFDARSVIFRYLPSVRTAWPDVWSGAAIAAALFLFGQWIIAIYLSKARIGKLVRSGRIVPCHADVDFHLDARLLLRSRVHESLRGPAPQAHDIERHHT
jgi:hypothetical protein